MNRKNWPHLVSKIYFYEAPLNNDRSDIDTEKKTSEKKMVTIRIRPQDGEWVMADDYEVTVPFDLSIMNLKKVIEEERGIHHERSNIMHPRVKKYIEKNRESWYDRNEMPPYNSDSHLSHE